MRQKGNKMYTLGTLTKKSFNGKQIEEVLEMVKGTGLDYSYEKETEEVEGFLRVGKYWLEHFEMFINEGICQEVEYVEWE